MAFRLSTALRNKLLEEKAAINAIAIFASSLTFVDGAGGNDSITDTGSGLGIFIPGDKITVEGSVSNDGTYEILTVAAGTIEVGTGLLAAEDATSIDVALASASGGSFNDIFRNGVMQIYTGGQPTTADGVELGTRLVEIINGGGAYGTFTSGSPAYGLNFGAAAAGILGKNAGEAWSGQADSTGTAGYFRFYPNDRDGNMGADAGEVKIRFDGSVSTSGAQLNMSNTSITSGGTTTIDTVAVTIPTA